MLKKIGNWARCGSWQGKLLRFPLSLLPSKKIIPIINGKSRGKKWIVGSAEHGAWLGTYEFEKQTEFARFVRKGMIVYDIGAHVGVYTLLSSILVGDEGRVIAFEPLPDNLVYLYSHIEINDLQNVKVVEAAISDMTGLSTFITGCTSSRGQLDTAGDLTVQVFTLDEVAFKKKLPMPDVIKIDIEGAEAKALKGAVEILNRASPIIFLATHGDKIREKCCTLLTSHGYTMTPLKGDKTGSEFIAERFNANKSFGNSKQTEIH